MSIAICRIRSKHKPSLPLLEEVPLFSTHLNSKLQATVSLLRWLRRQLREPTPFREHLEAAVANDDPREARRLLEQMSFTEAQRRHVEGLLARWDDTHGRG